MGIVPYKRNCAGRDDVCIVPYKRNCAGGTMWASSPTRGTKKLVILHKNGFWVLDKLPKGCYNFGNFIDKSYDEDGISKGVLQRAGDGGSLANCG